MGIVTAAKDQLNKMCLGELILATNDFSIHNKINQIGPAGLEKLKVGIKASKEYKYINKTT